MDCHRQPSISSSSNNYHHRRRSSPRSSPPSVYHYQRSPPSPPPRSEPLNLQTRRLQLRNARFQAASISPSKVSSVSDRFSTWRSLSPGSDISADKENQPASLDEYQKPSGSVRRRVSILQEIHDSSQRGRKSRRPSVTRLFGPPLEDSELYSQQRYRSPSILADSHAERVMATYTQTRSSPLSSGHEDRPRSSSRDRARTNHANERYIEHLETQLAAAQNQLSPMQAASTSKPQATKLRSLGAEIKVLRQELSEWEDKFDTRVSEEVSLRTDIESKLRTKIVFLEGQLEDYATRVKELECERDLQAQKLRNVESLRTTNRSLERRIDVLTELLAQSPTRIEPRSPELSPTRSPGPRLSRPKSMLPSVSLRTDLAHQPLVDPILSADPEAGVEKHDSESGALPDLIPDDSTVASSLASKSQRSSTISHPSSASSRWSVPLPFSPELQGKTPGRSRNMRRFPSGTCSLKPLILPATATPTPTSPQRQSLPIDLHLSMYSPHSDRGMPNTAQEETLAALEGRTHRYQTFEEAMSEPEDDIDSPLSSRLGSSSHSNAVQSTLFSELEEAERRNLSIRSRGSHSFLMTNPSTPIGSRRFRTHSARSDSYSTPKAYNNPPHPHSQPAKPLSTCSSSRSVPASFRDFQSSVGTFARTLIAGIWQKSMRRLGMVSWWVLGILLGSLQRDEWLQGSSLIMRSSPGCYTCGQSPRERHTNNETNRSSSVSRTPRHEQQQHNVFGHSLAMWAKFSVVMVMAFGRAVRYGPEAVLTETETESDGETSVMRYNNHNDNGNDNNNPPQTNRHIFGHDGAVEDDIDIDNDMDAEAISPGYTSWTRPLRAEDFFGG